MAVVVVFGAIALADGAALADAFAAGSVMALGAGSGFADAVGGVAVAFMVGCAADGAAETASLVILSPGFDSLLLHAATATRAAPCVRRMRRSSR